MVVEKQRHSQKKPSNIHPHITSTSLGSSFAPLDVDNDIDVDFTPTLATVNQGETNRTIHLFVVGSPEETGVQRILNSLHSTFLVQLEVDLLLELENLLDEEELLWQHKSRTDCIILGIGILNIFIVVPYYVKNVIVLLLFDWDLRIFATMITFFGLLSRLVDHVNWPVFFAVAIWLIWKRQNDVFNTELGSSSNVLNRSMVWAKYVCNSNAAKLSSFTNPTTSSATASSCKWQPASTSWITLNTDGVVSSSGHGAVGGLLRNADGSWVMGFSRAIWMTNSLHAELWAIHDGLVFAWALGINQIHLQSDNLLAVNLLKSQDATSSSFSLVRAIATLLHRAWLVDMSWIPREGNNPADWLAKKALGSSCRPLILDSPPPDLLPLLSTDVHGASLVHAHGAISIVTPSGS
ncbi:hypothetical protein GQ457_18G005180 [Hibiscus cannabinus]